MPRTLAFVCGTYLKVVACCVCLCAQQLGGAGNTFRLWIFLVVFGWVSVAWLPAYNRPMRTPFWSQEIEGTDGQGVHFIFPGKSTCGATSCYSFDLWSRMHQASVYSFVGCLLPHGGTAAAACKQALHVAVCVPFAALGAICVGEPLVSPLGRQVEAALLGTCRHIIPQPTWCVLHTLLGCSWGAAGIVVWSRTVKWHL